MVAARASDKPELMNADLLFSLLVFISASDQ